MADDAFDRMKDSLQGGLHVIKKRTRAIAEFKNFIARGSALDLAIGVVVGAAFNSVVQSLVKDVLTPIVSLPGRANFDDLSSCLKDPDPLRSLCDVRIYYGRFVTTLVSFLLTAAAVFFFVVRPLGRLRAWRKADEEAAKPETRDCPECLTEVPLAASRCRACTAVLAPAGAPGGAGAGPATPG